MRKCIRPPYLQVVPDVPAVTDLPEDDGAPVRSEAEILSALDLHMAAAESLLGEWRRWAQRRANAV